ncbi:hypothetical protein CTM_02049 [Clostridium tetanomorphum DSM 665]|nr:hypothetical protein CTM_02049 [Clostridium tetanomorphum DSM 665]SQB92425.1 putative exonuclease [Clostridium tetanomorphum]
MIFSEKHVEAENVQDTFSFKHKGYSIYKDAIFFDLEHYVYKKPICVGVFGACYYDEEKGMINITQYMIEDKSDSIKILNLAKKYFQDAYKKNNKKYIVTFSGNNDFTVINYLLQKYGVDFDIKAHFTHVDIQKEYEKAKGSNIGLKVLEKEFNIERESELISGQNLAKTFGKIMKDKDYINRMPKEKKEKILLYNEQDVVSLFYMSLNWLKVIGKGCM